MKEGNGEREREKEGEKENSNIIVRHIHWLLLADSLKHPNGDLEQTYNPGVCP